MKYLFQCLVLITLVSCSSPDSSFTPSDQFIDSNVKFSEIDTIAFKMTTFKLDSIITDTGDKILVGQYVDPQFGKIKAAGFVDYVPKDLQLDEDAVFDSVVLNLPYTGYVYNDTLLQKHIKVEQLGKIIKLRNGQSNFYNTTDFPTTGIIGQRSFYPRITSSDSIKITLNPSFGLSLFNKIRDGVIDNMTDLKLQFKGIKISADENENAAVVGFKSADSYIRFYYSMPDEPGEAKYYDFIYNDTEGVKKYFSQISSDRTGTVFPDFSSQELEFAPTASVPYTYINAGVGIVTKITFPHFKESIENLNQSGFIYKAKMKIPLNENFISKNFYTGDSLLVYVVDQNNNIRNALKNGGKQAVGYISKANPEYNEVYLELPVGDFLQSTLNDPLYSKYGLMLVPFDYNTSTTRTILNSQQNTQEKSKLILTYLTYGN